MREEEKHPVCWRVPAGALGKERKMHPSSSLVPDPGEKGGAARVTRDG